MSASTARPKTLLLVEPDAALRAALVAAAGARAVVEAHDGFDSARPRVLSSVFDLIVTSLRLAEYNGLHLVILATSDMHATPAIVYGEEDDLPLASNAQRVGAFFELRRRMPVVLPAYLGATLPREDRRNALKFDRRIRPRGGRRAWDAHVTGLAGSM